MDNITFTHRGERHFSAARGLFGGEDGAHAQSVIIRSDGTVEEIPSKVVTRLMRGDRVIVETAGGAGYGDSSARDPAAVADDIADGKTSRGHQ